MELELDLDNDVVRRLVDENEGLKAALADLQTRLEELERLANTDTLLPLPNRRAFLKELDHVLNRAAGRDMPAAVLFIDLNGLKAINDCHGHQAGDAVLLHVASILKASLGADDMVARIGGDEFGLILDGLDEPAARAEADLLARTVANEPVDLGRVVVKVSVTAGLAMVRAGDDVETVLARADAAMYAQRSER
jgi:diguanylate cyclase (GGDEF)-like protein